MLLLFWNGAGGGGPPPAEETVFGGQGGGSKRYWDWIRGRKSMAAHVSGREVELIRQALKGKVAEAKKKRKPTILKMAQVIKEEAAVIPPEAYPELEALGLFVETGARDAEAFRQTLERDRDLIEAAYVAVLEERELRRQAWEAEIEADDAEVMALYMERRRKIIKRALKLLEGL